MLLDSADLDALDARLSRQIMTLYSALPVKIRSIAWNCS